MGDSGDEKRSRARRRLRENDKPSHQEKPNYENSPVRLQKDSPKLVQIAPQLKVTDRHCRMFTRQLTHRSQLWTEMVVDSTIIHTDDLARFLGHDDREHPLVLQIGGCCEEKIRDAAIKALEFTCFDELNLNVGCPSNRVVEKGAFGACLMREPDLVSKLGGLMMDAVKESKNPEAVVVSVKTRIGVDSKVGGSWLEDTIRRMGASGLRDFCMHARPAILGMSATPAQNRSIPPLDHEVVFELERKFGNDGYRFSLNGGVKSVEEILELLHRPSAHDENRSALAGVMVGRRSTDDPCMLANVDTAIYGEKSDPESALSRATVLEGYMKYLDEFFRLTEPAAESPQPPSHHKKPNAFVFVRPVNGLFYCSPGSKVFRQSIDRETRTRNDPRAPVDILQKVFTSLETSCPEILHAPIVASY